MLSQSQPVITEGRAFVGVFERSKILGNERPQLVDLTSLECVHQQWRQLTLELSVIKG